jgi:Tol biopolymer transport system component
MAGGGLAVAAISTNQSTYLKSVAANGAQSPWFAGGGHTTGMPGLAVDPGNGQWHLAIDQSGVGASARSYTPATKTWTEWTPLGGHSTSGLGMAAVGPGHIELFRYDNEKILYNNTFQHGAWNWPSQVHTPDEPPFWMSRLTEGVSRTEANGPSWGADLGGNFKVAFASSATNLVPGDTNGHADVFVRHNSVSTRVSVATDSTQGNGRSDKPSSSRDGRFVAFESDATNLVSGDTNGSTDIFVRDLTANTTARVSLSTDGAQRTGGGSYAPKISSTGRYLTYETASNVFIYDLEGRTTSLVSAGVDGAAADGASYGASVSRDGRYVAFGSRASNLVAGDTNGRDDVFVRDMLSRTTTRVSVASDGSQAGSSPGRASISGSGRKVAFLSDAANLVPGDTNNVADVFVHDRSARTTERVSVGPGGAQANGASDAPQISDFGDDVVFASTASNLARNDTNMLGDIFVRHTQSAVTVQVSVGSRRTPTSRAAFAPAIYNRTIVFHSDAPELASDDKNGLTDVFRYERHS